MGLQDRDYMHERQHRDPPFTPPEPGTASTWIAILLVVTTLFALYRGYDWLLERRGQKPRPTANAPFTVQLPKATRIIVQQQPTPLPASCVGHGCADAAEVPDVAASSRRMANPDRPRPTEPVPSQITLYHCKAYSGGTFWANAHCNQHKALVDRMVNVPGSLPFDQQVHLAESQRQSAMAQPTVHAVTNTVIKQPTHREECEALDAQVLHWDAMARQPQSGPTQDWIREQRKKARDRQFALRC